MKLKFCSKLTSTLIVLGSMTVPVIASLSYVNAQNQPEAPESTTYPPQIEGELVPPSLLDIVPIPNMREVSPKQISPGGEIKVRIRPSTELDITPSQTEEITPQSVAIPEDRVATFDQTVVRKRFTFRVFDNATVDGDLVTVFVNGNVERLALPLTAAGERITVNLQAGSNSIDILALNEGSISPNTVGIEYIAPQVLEKETKRRVVDITLGNVITTTVGLPQIALCKTVVQFPCTKTHPESAQHVLEAQGVPPEPITAPLIPGRTGNEPRARYPRLLRIDRDTPKDPNKVDNRRNRSTNAYECPNSKIQDKDEYPPALFAENEGSAHIKCINRSDNRGSGSSFQRQLEKYKVSPTSPPVAIANGDSIEFVILR